MHFDSWAFQTSTFEKYLWTAPVMSYRYWRWRDCNTSSRFRYQSYSSSVPALERFVPAHANAGVRRAVQVLGRAVCSLHSSALHTQQTDPQQPLSCHCSATTHWTQPARVYEVQHTSQERLPVLSRSWCYEHPDSILMATFLMKWQCRAGRVATFMPGGLISLGRLLGLPCVHYMNQKYISGRLHRSRESAVYCKFTLDYV